MVAFLSKNFFPWFVDQKFNARRCEINVEMKISYNNCMDLFVVIIRTYAGTSWKLVASVFYLIPFLKKEYSAF